MSRATVAIEVAWVGDCGRVSRAAAADIAISTC